MIRALRTAVIAATLLAVSAAPAHAAVNTYTNFADWLAAVGGYSTESFNSFVADESIRNVSVAVTGMTISGTFGANGTNTQKIDAAPFQFAPDSYALDGSSYLLGDLDGPTQFIRFDLATPVAAWSIETSGIGDGRPTTISIFDGSNNLLGSLLTSSTLVQEKQFYGFALTGGQAAKYVTITNPGNTNDAFGIDNVRFATTTTVPEPSTVALMAAGLFALGVSVRRRAAGRI